VERGAPVGARQRDHLAGSKSNERVNDDAAADAPLVAAAPMQVRAAGGRSRWDSHKPQAERAVEPVNAPYAAGALDEDEGSRSFYRSRAGNRRRGSALAGDSRAARAGAGRARTGRARPVQAPGR
jgi:hypothetical protein